MISEMEEKVMKLDNHFYDWLVIGTGIEESMFAAHLAKVAGKKLLVVDTEKTYSSNTKTMNFKEFHQFYQDLNQIDSRTDEIYLRRQKIFEGCSEGDIYAKLNDQFASIINAGHDFKYFNIDVQPRLLYSTSPTVDLMQQADMDQYMDFKAIEAQYYFEKKLNKFVVTPTSKSGIFNSSFLSLFEKKKMFQLLHTFVNLCNLLSKHQIDPNSIDEFDKDHQVDAATQSLYESMKGGDAYSFVMKLIGNMNPESGERIVNIFFCALCLVNEVKKIKCEAFLLRLVKFIRSLGVHTSGAFLYTNYGTGDIAQGFSRIAAVYGTDYILQQNLKITRIEIGEWQEPILQLDRDRNNFQQQQLEQGEEQDEKSEENQKQSLSLIKLKISSNICKEDQTINLTTGILIEHDFLQNMQNVCPQLKQTAEIKTPLSTLLRLTIITTKWPDRLPEEQRNIILELNNQQIPLQDHSDFKKPTYPILYVIPPNSGDVDSSHPVYIFRTDKTSNTTHKNYEGFFIKTKIETPDESHTLIQKIVEFIKIIDTDYMQDKDTLSLNYICYVCPYLQHQFNDEEEIDKDFGGNNQSQNFQIDKNLPIFCGSEDQFDLDLDYHSKHFKNNIIQLNQNFEQGFYMISNPEKNKNQTKNEDPQENQMDSILKQLHQLSQSKAKETPTNQDCSLKEEQKENNENKEIQPHEEQKVNEQQN